MYLRQNLIPEVSLILVFWNDSPLLCCWGHIGNSSLIHFSHPSRLNILSVLFVRPIGILLQTRQREPSVIIRAIVGEFFFVLNTSLAKDSELDAGAISIYVTLSTRT